MTQLEQVFGVSNKLVLSYIRRQGIDTKLKSAFDEGKHIIIYGASKQGKTSLLASNLANRKAVRVYCSPSASREVLYTCLLGELGAKVVEHRVSTYKFAVEVGGEGKFGGLAGKILGAEGKVSGTGKGEHAVESLAKSMPIDLENVQDVHRAFQAAGGEGTYVVLENFHYLPERVQREIAFDLRLWNDLNTTFVVIGIWKGNNYLQAKNPELADRVVEIPVEPWSVENFLEVVAEGSPHLNIEIPGEIASQLAGAANGSIGVFQELLKLYCKRCGVEEAIRGRNAHELSRGDLVPAVLAEKAKEYESTYFQQLALLARSEAGNKGNPLYLRYYLVHYMLDNDVDLLQRGVTKAAIATWTSACFHRPIDPNTIVNQYTVLFDKLTKVQVDLEIPPLVQYTGFLLKIVDPIFAFYLKNADLVQVRDNIPFPVASES